MNEAQGLGSLTALPVIENQANDVSAVEEGVQDDGGLAGLAINDDELELAAADRDQGVDGIEAGGHRLVH
ncbi:hypothetical protein VE26_10360, partial [Devosia chinhatensis]